MHVRIILAMGRDLAGVGPAIIVMTNSVTDIRLAIWVLACTKTLSFVENYDEGSCCLAQLARWRLVNTLATFLHNWIFNT